MVADEHGPAGDEGRTQPTTTVREYDDAATGGNGSADTMYDGVNPQTLVEVRAPEEDQRPVPAGGNRADPAGVPFHCRRRKPGQLSSGEVMSRPVFVAGQDVCRRNPAGPQHKRHVVPLDAGHFTQPLRCRVGETIGVEGRQQVHAATIAARLAVGNNGA